jgi:hypothetical protein
MKKVVLVVVSLLLFAGWAQAQVMENFESTNSWSDFGWGAGVGSIGIGTDPSNASNHVLQVNFDLNKGNRATFGFTNQQPATKAQIILFYVYLPANTPDALQLEVFAQDNSHWSHTEGGWINAVDIPKETWYPIYMPIKAWQVKNAASFDVTNNAFGKLGMDMNSWGLSEQTWSGNILVDNITYLGVNPTVLSSFEAGNNNWSDFGWGAGVGSLVLAADPSNASNNVLQLNFDLNKGNRATIGFTNQVPATNAQAVSFNVWLPANTPDSLQLEVFAQDNSHWSHTEGGWINAVNIPKEVWYPIVFELQAKEIKNSATFDVKNNAFGKLGLDFNSWKLPEQTWSGNILIDNVSFLTEVVESKWVVSNFETPASNLDGFYITTNQQTVQYIERVADATDEAGKNHAIQANLDLSLGWDGQVAKDNLTLYNSVSKSSATKITLDVYVPAGFPTGATASLALKGLGTTDLLLSGDGKAIVPGEWNTVTLNTTAMIDGGLLNTQKAVSVYANIRLAQDNSWKGAILIDNLTIVGIEAVIRPVASPVTIARVKSSIEDAGGIVPYNYILLEWIDNLKGSETYNIYVSKKPITSTFSKDVIRIATAIPHGQLAWAYRPYTSDGSEQTYYLAITANDGTRETEVTTSSKVGPLTLTTSKTTKVQYAKNFGNSFVLDGNIGEFYYYGLTGNYARPEIDGNQRRHWFPGSTDFDYKTLFLIDDNYLYMSSVITDDEPNLAAGLPGWSSAMEYFIGFYNAAALRTWHSKGISNDQTTGDWRIGITPNGELETNGSNAGMTIPGVEAATHVTPEGTWTVEARFDLKQLGKDGAFELTDGMWMPYRIDGSDNDPSKGDGTNRGLFAQVNGWGPITVDGVQMDSNWDRPCTQGFMEVMGLTDVAQDNNGLPTSYALYNNYPNPFNPTTNIKYDLPKETKVSLKIYDILGREVATLVDTKQTAGRYEVNFNATKVASGVYIYRLIAGDFVQTMKMMLLK